MSKENDKRESAAQRRKPTIARVDMREMVPCQQCGNCHGSDDYPAGNA
jgi:hypothetical protein